MKNSPIVPKSILITGASSGIGAALAVRYAAPGIMLFLSGRNSGRLEGVARQCVSRGANAETQIIDVRDRSAMDRWIDACNSKGALDLVIANAGISGGTGGGGENGDQIREIFDINVGGVLNTIDPAIRLMTQRKSGQIGIVSSLASFTGWPGAPAYSASKASIRVYGEALRGSLRDTGIMVSVICPGFIETPMTAVNDYPMPFIIDADSAARHIARGLAQDRARISFPFLAYGISGLIGLAPPSLTSLILSKLPQKPSRTPPLS